MNEKVRIHLKQAILIGYGEEAKYAKVLVGERETTADIVHHSTVYQSFVIFGFVRGYQGFTLSAPTRMRMADSNILAIEDAKVEDWRLARRQTKLCRLHRSHPPHTYENKGPVIQCPGKEAEYKPEIMWCAVRRSSEPVHTPHHYYDRQGRPVCCPGWGN